jgi:ATP-dependent RNA helicase DDX5/DBP2
MAYGHPYSYPYNRPSYNFSDTSDLNGKQLAPTDFSSLPPVRKDFYRVHPDVQKKSQQDIARFFQSNSVIVHGENVPAPCEEFVHAGFGRDILDTLRACNFTEPTLIQKISFPVALSGRDLVENLILLFLRSFRLELQKPGAERPWRMRCQALYTCKRNHRLWVWMVRLC